MEILLLRAHGSGYRGCIMDDNRYLFFQWHRRKGLKLLKSYTRQEFTSTEQFIAMMQKFVTPPLFLHPPIPIKAFTIEELDRVYAHISPPA